METTILSIKGDVIFKCEGEVNLREAVQMAISKGVNLAGAALSYANLSYANLSNANFARAYLAGADLTSAILSSADLAGANLANANLTGAILSGADLAGANLSNAYLSCADFSKANLDNVYTNENTSFFSPQCPSEGSFIGWKKARGLIVKLLITEDAKRSSATSLKCRCSKAKVLDIQDIDGASIEDIRVSSDYSDSFIYEAGKIVEVEDFDENRWEECSAGIHFFIARENAVNY